MNQINKYNLIDATYEPSDAKELLTELYRSKINFHNLKNFSSIIRFDKPVIGSTEKINELKKTKEDIINLLQIAAKENKNIKIVSNIAITFVDK